MLLSVFLPIMSFSADINLEVDYLNIPGKGNEMGDIFQYVEYVFNLSIWIIGIIAFFLLILAGIRYLTSTGNPSAVNNAKSQITSIFVGIAILFLSVIILNNINPEITKLENKELEDVEMEAADFNLQDNVPDPLVRIKDIAEEVKNDIMPSLIIKHKELIKRVKKCDCFFSNSQCDCIGWNCTEIKCYGDPCVNRKEIVEQQINIVLFNAILSYNKNKTDTEREDIRAELDHFIYWERLTETQANNLEKHLEEIVPLMEELASKSLENSELPDECLIPDKCSSHCRGKCHNDCDNATKCRPKACTGDNPCPVEKLEKILKEMEVLQGKISSLCVKIITILN